MSVYQLMVGVAGVLLAAGVVALVAAVTHRPDPSAVPALRLQQQRRTGFSPLVGAAILVGLLVLVITRWPIGAVGAGLAVWFVPSVIGGGRASREAIARSEAVASWTRRLSDLLASGAAGSLDSALRRSALNAPMLLAAAVNRLVSRIQPLGIEVALRRFADEIDDPTAERVAAALILRSRHGGRGLPEVLGSLASDLEERVRMVREIEAERSKPRTNTRTIVMITFALVGAMVVFARDFLSPYSTFIGQLGLVLVVGIFALALRWLRKLSAPMANPRFLVDPPGMTATSPAAAGTGVAS